MSGRDVDCIIVSSQSQQKKNEDKAPDEEDK